MLLGALQSLTKPALELSKRPALLTAARGASPSMRERRVNGGYDALCTGQVANSLTHSPKSFLARVSTGSGSDLVKR